MAERLRVREIDDDEGRHLVRIVRRGTGSVVTWRRAQMVLLSAQGMDVAAIARVAFTSDDRVRDVIRNFNADGFGSLYPRYRGGHPPKFTLPQRREIKKIAKSKPAEHDLPFSAWSLPKLADFLVAEGVVDDISHEGLRVLLREEGVTFQRMKTWKAPKDPDYAVKKARVEHLYAIADREVTPEAGEPEVIICMDEFGPLNLQPRPGRHWAAVSGKSKEPGRADARGGPGSSSVPPWGFRAQASAWSPVRRSRARPVLGLYGAAARIRAASAAAAAAGSSASVIARTTTTRRAPAASTAPMFSRPMPPMANQGTGGASAAA